MAQLDIALQAGALSGMLIGIMFELVKSDPGAPPSPARALLTAAFLAIISSSIFFSFIVSGLLYLELTAAQTRVYIHLQQHALRHAAELLNSPKADADTSVYRSYMRTLKFLEDEAGLGSIYSAYRQERVSAPVKKLVDEVQRIEAANREGTQTAGEHQRASTMLTRPIQAKLVI
jgi:hypothetical protein